MNALSDDALVRLLRSLGDAAAADFADIHGTDHILEGLRRLREDPDEARRINALATELNDGLDADEPPPHTDAPPHAPDALSPETFDSFEELYRQMAPQIFALLRRMGADSALAEDIVQDTMLTAMRQWSRVRTLQHPRAYLMKLASRFLTRERRRRAETPLPQVSIPDVELEPDQRAVLNTVANLPDRQRAIAALVIEQGLTTGEAAEVLGLSVRVARARLAAARRELSHAAGEQEPSQTDAST